MLVGLRVEPKSRKRLKREEEKVLIRYYNIKTYKNKDGKNIVINRRNAAVLVVEPKIKAPFDGTLHIETAHDEITIMVKNGKQEKKYVVRRSDVAKPNELAGVSGRLEGKLYIAHESGYKVAKGGSIVDIVKDGWNVPNRIPYASEIIAQDNAPISQKIYSKEQGVVKYYLLEGDHLERVHDFKRGDIVTEKGIFAVIADKYDREATRHYIARDSKILVDDNSRVEMDTLLAEPAHDVNNLIATWDSYNTITISDIDGVVSFEDIVLGLTATEQEDKTDGKKKLKINDYIPSGFKPSIIITNGKDVRRYALEPNTTIAPRSG